MGQPPGGGCFAIGARDGHHLKRLAGLFVIGSCNRPTGGFQPCIGGDGWVLVPSKSVSAHLLDHASCRTLIQRSCDKLTAIRHPTRPRNEAVACANASAVGVQRAAHLGAQPLGGIVWAMESLHQNDSFSTWVTT